MPEQTANKTVLILGAGASWNCNFPLGTGLIDKITTEHNREEFPKVIRRILFNSREYIKQNGLLDQLPKPIVDALTHDKISTFLRLPKEEFSKWTKLVGPFRSIDEFISYRKEFSLLAKLSILLLLSQSEDPEFFENRQFIKNNIPFNAPERIWYHNLWWNIVRRDTTFEDLKRILKTFHIITFNYDRSLDFFLLDAIKKYFPESEKDYTDLPITHVYGSLGDLDKNSPLHNPYRQIYYRERTEIPEKFRMTHTSTYDTFSHEEADRGNYDIHLLKMATAIQTYGSEYPEEKRKNIQNLIINAENNYVFGFSFFDQNMKILFEEVSESHQGRIAKGAIDGTIYGISKEDVLRLGIFFSRYFGNTQPFMRPDRKGIDIAGFFADSSIKI